jgi:O-acetyl-ADP-ribose deacetylase (regulator of RNase III)
MEKTYRHIIGDLLQQHDVDVIVHQVNCQGVMGAGIAKQIREQFPNTYETYRKHCYNEAWKESLLGTCLYTKEDRFDICNAFGQNFYFRNSVQTQYDKLEMCLKDVAKKYKGKTVGLPWLIGCGLAGGDWTIVEAMIRRVLFEEGGCSVLLVEWPT